MSKLSYPILYEQVIHSLPPEWESPFALEEIKNHWRTGKRKVMVLDDDPTAVQTVHNIYVLTQWDKHLLRETIKNSSPLLFILTNTRVKTPEEAKRINKQIVSNVLEIASEEGYEIDFISRSDSTLRGHYPLEIDVISSQAEKYTGKGYDGHFIVPAFFEGNRYTYKNIHYLRTGADLVPVHLTEYAKDRVFGYSHSDLRFWTAEKTYTRFRPEQCISITVDVIRQGPESVAEKLTKASNNVPIIINAMSYADLQVVTLAVLRVYPKGKRFLYRSAASFVRAFIGMDHLDYLPGESLMAKGSNPAGHGPSR